MLFLILGLLHERDARASGCSFLLFFIGVRESPFQNLAI